MKFLLIGANPDSGTDGVIVQGIKNYLNRHYKCEYDYLLILDHSPMTNFNEDKQYEAIIYCGTPYIWDQMWKSHKYANTVKLIKKHPEAKMIWFGIGSCLNLSDIDGPILRDKESGTHLRELFVDLSDKVIVRDNLASKILSTHNIEHDYAPCPSYLCYESKPSGPKKGAVMVWFDPTKGISFDYWLSRPQELDVYKQKFIDFNKSYKPEIICANKSDLDMAKKLGFSPRLVTKWQETLDIMSSAEKVLSGRVHLSVPAFVAGADIELVPTDSRALTLHDFMDKNLDDILYDLTLS